MLQKTDIATKLKESLFLRRVLAFLYHIVGMVVCYLLSFFLRLDFDMGEIYGPVFVWTLPIALANYTVFTLAFGLHRGLWSFFSFRDCYRYAVAYLVASIVFTAWIYAIFGFSFSGYPRSVIPIYYLLLLGWEVGGRGTIRLMRDFQSRTRDGAGRKTILVGEPEECDQLVRSLVNPRLGIGDILAIISQEKRRENATLHGIPLFHGLDQVGQIAKSTDAEMVLIVPPFATPNTIKRILMSISDAGHSAEYRVIPSLKDIAEGHVDVSSLRRVEIEDLLNRKPNKFDRGIIEDFLTGQSVLITGAGGSIGSEICRQVLTYNPSKLVLFDSSEFNLFEINRELTKAYPDKEIYACMGDVADEPDVIRAMDRAGGVDVIYHAAAYKHVHLAEENIPAVMSNNVFGTMCVAEIALQRGVKHFILVSTDKAVRPTSMMGASKRLAERTLLERPKAETSFKAVRFGNVLGSSGSVIPIFKNQIAEGGPVTVTSPDVTRFFMTIPEAVELVLMAGAVGQDRNIMVLEMGDPVKIDLLARQLIELSGLVPDKDIEIKYVGLRKGEKEYEELLTEDENVVQTAYDKIWVMEKEKKELKPVDLKLMHQLIQENRSDELRQMARDLIPENRLNGE